MVISFELFCAFIIDLIIGDPHWLYHPVSAIGFLISKGEVLFRRLLPDKPVLAGGLMSVCVLAISFFIPFFLLKLAASFSSALYIILQTIFCAQLLATKSLKDESMRVYGYLKQNDIENSRKYVGYIVGRDTSGLNETQIAKAVVETVAENTSDGVIAPMLYFALGGAPLMFLYKAVNTLDSMVGYKNERYLYFGRIAAKIDDLFNFIPSRLSAAFMITSCFFCGYDSSSALKIFIRDRKKHSSPNSAQTESVVAGALGVQLGGNAYYFGKLYEKQAIGDNKKNIDISDIIKTIRIMYVSAALCVALICIIRALIFM